LTSIERHGLTRFRVKDFMKTLKQHRISGTLARFGIGLMNGKVVEIQLEASDKWSCVRPDSAVVLNGAKTSRPRPRPGL